jgi:hypothetical protein
MMVEKRGCAGVLKRKSLRCLALVAAVAYCGTGGKATVPHAHGQPVGVRGAVACDARGRDLRFPLASAAADPALQPGLLTQTPLPVTALETSQPRLAAVCAAVFQDAAAAGDPFALEPGRVTFSVEGAAQIVESGARTYSVACGDAQLPRSYTGGRPSRTAVLRPVR